MSFDFLSSPEILASTEAVDVFLREHFARRAPEVQSLSIQLLQSMEYSLFSGGKRFRPALSLVVHPKAVAWASAIEMVHTYSLIHDDLPCMDNDDERRGQPTNHKKFGESLALLAGDALLTESFLVIAEAYADRPTVVARLVQILARSSGMGGMVGGQAMDMNLGNPLNGAVAVEKVHLTKTAELIAAALEGAAVMDGITSELQKKLRQVGLNLGLCFQIKDDLLDGEQDQSPKSLLHFLSEQDVTEQLKELTRKSLLELNELPAHYQKLKSFFEYNEARHH